MLPGGPQSVNACVALGKNQRVTCTGVATDYLKNCSCCDLGQWKVSCEIYTHMLYMLPLLASVTYAGILL